MKSGTVGKVLSIGVIISGLVFAKPASAYTIVYGIPASASSSSGSYSSVSSGYLIASLAVAAVAAGAQLLATQGAAATAFAPEGKALNPAFDAMDKATGAEQAMAYAPGASKGFYKANPLARPDWDGLYAGAALGWGAADTRWNDTFGDLAGVPGNSLRVNPDGFFGSLLAGYNWRSGAFVYGVEGEFAWSGMDGDTTVSLPPAVGTFRSRARWMASAVGRAGFLSRDPFYGRSMLFYLKGGAAWANFRNSFVLNGALGPFDFGEQSRTASGWTIGLGLEVLLGSGWAARIESNYYGFGSKRFDFFLPAFGPARFDTDLSMVTSKVGLTYRFGGL